MKNLLTLLLLTPLATAAFNLLVGRHLSRRAVETFAVAGVGLPFLLGLLLWPQAAAGLHLDLYQWARIEDFVVPFSLNFDRLSATLTVTVTSVACLIHLYAVGYLHDEPDYQRFFVLLNLFVFAMLGLILADDLILLFLGWEGVGFCSYALIGFWYRSDANAAAGQKAFLVTRIGDVGFGIALLWLFAATGSLSLRAINAGAGSLPAATITGIGLLLLFGACGKSAQLPLSSWLPDAMAGPTPVSALLHAATMVTAGVYLLCRLFPLISLSPGVLTAIAAIGSATLLYGASCALAQHDLKRVLAYSTMSQVGYMFLAIGVGTVGDAIFHLVTHACFKAALFMGAGCLIVLAGGEHDLRRMGGLARRSPRLFALVLGAALCLAGVPLTDGFFSKDAILEQAALHSDPLHRLFLVCALLGVFLTALYTFRLLYLVFANEPRSPASGAAPTPLLLATIAPLTLAGLLAGGLNLPPLFGGTTRLSHWLEPHTPHAVLPVLQELLLLGLATALCLAGWLLARRFCRTGTDRLGENAFFLGGWGIERLQAWLILRPFARIGRFCLGIIEGRLIGGALGALTWLATGGVELHHRLINGRLSRYLTAFACGLAVIVLWLALTSGGGR